MMMRKWLMVPVIIALLLVGNTAMAKGGQGNHATSTSTSSTISLDAQVAVCSEIPSGLLNAITKVKNPKAKASIQKNIDKHILKCEDDNDDQEWTDEQRVAADKAALKIVFSDNDSATSVTGP